MTVGRTEAPVCVLESVSPAADDGFHDGGNAGLESRQVSVVESAVSSRCARSVSTVVNCFTVCGWTAIGTSMVSVTWWVSTLTVSTARSMISTAARPEEAARRCSQARCRHVGEHHFGGRPRGGMDPGKSAALRNLSDRQLVDSFNAPRSGEHVAINEIGGIVQGHHRIAEIVRRADDPASVITRSTVVHIDSYRRDVSMFLDLP